MDLSQLLSANCHGSFSRIRDYRFLKLVLLIGWMLFNFAFQGSAQQSLSYLEYTSGQTTHCYAEEVLLSPLNPDSFKVSGTAEVAVFSRNGIELRPGFSAKGFSSGGFFRAQIYSDCGGFTVNWTGAVSSDWSVAGNWSPAGVPGILDTIRITGTPTNMPVLDQDRELATLIMNGTELDMNGLMLTASDLIDLYNAEVVGNGKLYVPDGSLVNIEGSSVSAEMDVTSEDVDVDNSSFVAKVRMTKTAGGTNQCGGNIFYDSLYVTNTSLTYGFEFGMSKADTCYGPAIFRSIGSHVHVARASDKNYFASDLFLLSESTIGGRVSIHHAGGTEANVTYVAGDIHISSSGSPVYLPLRGTLQVGPGGTLIVADEGVTGNTGIWMDGIEFLGAGPDIVLDSIATTVDVEFENSVVRRKVVSTIPSGRFRTIDSEFFNEIDLLSARVYSRNTVYYDDVHLQKTGSSSDLNGGNRFEGDVELELDSSATNNWFWGYLAADTFERDVSLVNYNDSKLIAMGYGNPDYFQGDVNLSGKQGAIVRLGGTNSAYRVVFNGSDDQGFSLIEPLLDQVYRMEIDKPTGSLITNSNSIIVITELTLTSGIWEFSGGNQPNAPFKLELVDNVTVSAGNTSFVDGPIRKWGNDAFTFPLGDNGVYKPITMSAPSSTTDWLEVEYNRQNPSRQIGEGFGDGDLEYLTPVDYWAVTEKSGISNVTWTIGWDSLDGYSNFATSELRIAGWDGSEWDDLGSASLSGDTVSGVISTASAVELDTIKYLALGSTNADMLPKGLEILVTVVAEPTDTTYGVMTLTPTLGIGGASLLLNGEEFLSKEALTENWENTNIVDTIYSLFGDSLELTDTISDMITGVVQNWVRPGLYDVKFVDSSGDTARSEVLVEATKEWGVMNNAIYSQDTLKKLSATNGWDTGYGSLVHFLDSTGNGAMQFRIADASATYAMGFKEGIVVDTGGYELMDFAVVVDNGDVDVWHNGVLTESVTSVAVDDTFRLERRSMTYRLLRNGEPMYSGSASAKRIQPAFAFNTALTQAVIQIFIFFPRFWVDFDVVHAACGYPTGSITANLSGPFAYLPGASISWERVGGTDPDYAPGDLTVSNLESGEYVFSLSYTNQTTPFEWTVHVDNWVNWQNLEEVVHYPNDASILMTDPVLQGTPPSSILSVTAGADSDNELASSNGDGRISFQLADGLATIGVLGFCPKSQVGVPGPWYVNTGLISLYFGLGNTTTHWFLSNGTLETQPSGLPAFATSPFNQEINITKTGSNVNYTHGVFNSAFHGSTGVSQAADWVIDGSPILYGGGYQDVHTDLDCALDPFENTEPCALMRKELDGGMHWVLDGKLRFQIDEEYLDGGASGSGSEQDLKYSVYNGARTVVVSNTGASPDPITDDGLKFYGDNRYWLNLNNIVPDGSYVLEVTSEKDETYYLRFKKGY